MPERGDIVILTPEGKAQDYIKRVIGLPGETIELREGQVFLKRQAREAGNPAGARPSC